MTDETTTAQADTDAAADVQSSSVLAEGGGSDAPSPEAETERSTLADPPDGGKAGADEQAGGGDKAEGEQDGESGDDADKDEAEGAPEEYADFTMPEGVDLDADTLEAAKPLFKEFNLSQDQAQKLVDLYAERKSRDIQSQLKAWNDQIVTWRDEAKADREIGGQAYNENLGVMKTALKSLATPELMELVNTNRPFTADHPEFQRLLYRVGKRLGEDTFVTGNENGGARSHAEILYPTMSKE